LVTDIGVDIPALQARRRPLCRACLDWSVRRNHLAGALGAALLARILALGWARRVPATRIVAFTPAGERAFAEAFGLDRQAIAGCGPSSRSGDWPGRPSAA
jgi:hypothetical protein